jgi:hypothetical protein
MTTATESINVYVLHHDKYAYVHVPALPIELFKDAIPDFRRYQDDEDLPLSRLQHVYSVTREFPEPAEISGFAEYETWTLPGESAEAFNRIWTENESRA